MLITRRVNRARNASAVILGVALAVTGSLAQAGARDQAKRMYDRIAGVPPTESELTEMVSYASGASFTDQEARDAAQVALSSRLISNAG